MDEEYELFHNGRKVIQKIHESDNGSTFGNTWNAVKKGALINSGYPRYSGVRRN